MTSLKLKPAGQLDVVHNAPTRSAGPIDAVFGNSKKSLFVLTNSGSVESFFIYPRGEAGAFSSVTGLPAGLAGLAIADD